jgi:inorganic pyrophosphatase
MPGKEKRFADLLSKMFRPHTWHGVSPGTPHSVNAYVEIVPTETVKLELNKQSGHLSVDRPQLFSSMCPTLYGFIPQTYCGERIAELCMKRTGLKKIKGDGDPLDICVLTEKDFAHGDLFVRVRPIGGLRMIDGGEADDKIIAVLDKDIAYGGLTDISQLPEGVINRLRHYFLTYKQLPDQEGVRRVQITDIYGAEEAQEVIRRSIEDYSATEGSPEARLEELRTLLVDEVIQELEARMKAKKKKGKAKNKTRDRASKSKK